jgi:SAM-dependent methyltransferase
MSQEPFVEANRRFWDGVAQPHFESSYYDVARFRQTRCSLRSIEREGVGDVAGRTLLHLQCHIGLDTLSWASLGADVTGVDFSPRSIALAEALATELDIPARFVCADVCALAPGELGAFECVTTSYGVLSWIRDLRPWARAIASSLGPGGTFFIVDEHPLASVVLSGGAAPYFHSQAPTEIAFFGSYAADAERLPHTTRFVWRHSLADVLTALLREGLALEQFAEHDVTFYRMVPEMVASDDGFWRLPADSPRVPLCFSARFRK